MAQSGKHAHVNTCDCVHAVHVGRAFLVRCENLDAITSKQVTEENYECLSLQSNRHFISKLLTAIAYLNEYTVLC